MLVIADIPLFDYADATGHVVMTNPAEFIADDAEVT